LEGQNIGRRGGRRFDDAGETRLSVIVEEAQGLGCSAEVPSPDSEANDVSILPAGHETAGSMGLRGSMRAEPVKSGEFGPKAPLVLFHRGEPSKS
jgi:hypothetical protein